MVTVMIVVLDKGFDLSLKVPWQEVVLQQNAVLESLMPPLDFTLGLRMIRCPAHMAHAIVFDVIRKFTGDVAGAII